MSDTYMPPFTMTEEITNLVIEIFDVMKNWYFPLASVKE